MNAPPVASLFDLRGRSIVVCGASGGIGSGVARRLHEAGASLVLHHHRGSEAAAALAADLAPRCTSVQADLSTDQGAAAVAAAAIDSFGRLDAWISAAGTQPVASFDQIDAAAMGAILESNVTAAHLGTVAAARAMGPDGGSVVHVASIEGLQPARGHSHYSAAKAAVIAHCRAAALELGSRRIRVNAVAPGLISRPGIGESWPDGVARWHAACPLGRLGQNDDVADACLFLVSDAARWITGTTLVVDGGILARPTW